MPKQFERPIISCRYHRPRMESAHTVYPKKYAHGFCFAVLCCGYTLTDFPISIRLTSLALWQSNDCSSASKATLMNMDKYFMWIHYERLHNHNKAKHNKTVCIFLGYIVHTCTANKIISEHNSSEIILLLATPIICLIEDVELWTQYLAGHFNQRYQCFVQSGNCGIFTSTITRTLCNDIAYTILMDRL